MRPFRQVSLPFRSLWLLAHRGGRTRWAAWPPALRIAAFAQATLIAGMTAVVMSRAGLILAQWYGASRWLIWVVVGFAAVSLVLNLITPSAGERAIWAPVALLLLASSTIVAIEGHASSCRRTRRW